MLRPFGTLLFYKIGLLFHLSFPIALAISMTTEWWRGCVIYQVYPRSYSDSNHDGIGDLPGITAKLEHIASLGVDAVWISPFFKSPMKDFGYDIADYRGIDPIFGKLEDFKNLLAKAHALELKVIIDQVLSHTSDQHAWFQESRKNTTNAKADWYVWADPKADGTPPNNWLSLFGGSAWQWEPRRQQYYLHNFLAEQADLNFHCPAVQEALLAEVEFWLEMGVDGFRFDVINFCTHDSTLPDNPPLMTGTEVMAGTPLNNPYSFQQHIYDISQPENLNFLRRLRALFDRYDNIASLGEIFAQDPLPLMAEYTGDNDKLNMAYSFKLLGEQSSAAFIREVVETMEARIGDGWPCWALSNHDAVRCVTRWGKGQHPQAFAKITLALLLSLRGSACIYQGEELGLPEADVPLEKIRDPYGIPFWPAFKGRDGCRTPMPWQSDRPNAGFSSVEPWLPVDAHHLPLSVDLQQDNPNSVLNDYRRFIHWRQQQPALVRGDICFVDGHPQAITFIRQLPEQQLLVSLNLTAQSMRYTSPIRIKGAADGHGFSGYTDQQKIVLEPYQAFYGLL